MCAGGYPNTRLCTQEFRRDLNGHFKELVKSIRFVNGLQTRIVVLWRLYDDCML